MLIPAGVLIDEKYEIRSIIGSGGMGVVYEAYQRSLERVVAVKMLTATTGIDDEDRQRFEREALILSRLAHTNIIQFYAYGIWKNVPYIVIERVNGLSLQHLLAKNQPLDLRLALDIARQVCEGLQHVHANDVLHRDLKPTNILTVDSPNGGLHTKLIDFGLAKLVGWTNFQKLTQTGMALGSVMYASPEQCLGQSLDARSDIYSLGCVLYQMLTGHAPYTADNATAVMFQQLNEAVGSTDHWSEVPAELQPLLAKCMAKEKERRYSSAAALNEDLGKLIEGRSAELEGMPVSADAGLGSLPNPFLPAAGAEANAGRKNFAVGALAFMASCLIIAGGFFLFKSADGTSSKPLPQSSVHGELNKLVNESQVGHLDEATARRMLSLIESYKRDRYFFYDRSNLILRAYHKAISYYYDRRDWAVVRKNCKQALEDCRDRNRDPDGNYYLNLVQSYHDGCVPAHCQLSLIPILEDSLKRYPDAAESNRFGLYVALIADYLELERFDDARQTAKRAAALDDKGDLKATAKWLLLGAYHKVVRNYAEKKDFGAVRKYCKHALQDCSGISAPRGEELYLVQLYHDASVPVHSHLSLVPLLQSTLKRCPEANPADRLRLYVALIADFLELKRFDDARRTASEASLSAIDEERKTGGKWLLMEAYHPLIKSHLKNNDYAVVRQYCQHAVKDCRGVYADNGSAYVYLVQAYYAASVPVHSELSLIALVEDTLLQFPKADPAQLLELDYVLAKHCLQLRRFDAARQAANHAASLAVSDKKKLWCQSVLQKCNEQRTPSGR